MDIRVMLTSNEHGDSAVRIRRTDTDSGRDTEVWFGTYEELAAIAELASLRTRNSELEEGIKRIAKEFEDKSVQFMTMGGTSGQRDRIDLARSSAYANCAEVVESILPPVSAIKAPDTAPNKPDLALNSNKTLGNGVAPKVAPDPAKDAKE